MPKVSDGICEGHVSSGKCVGIVRDNICEGHVFSGNCQGNVGTGIIEGYIHDIHIPPETYEGSTIIRPNEADLIYEWTPNPNPSDHYPLVGNGTQTPNDTKYVYTFAKNFYEKYELEEPPEDMLSCESVDIIVRIKYSWKFTASVIGLTVWIYDGDNILGSAAKNIDDTADPVNITFSNVATGLSLTQSDMTDLRVQYRSDGGTWTPLAAVMQVSEVDVRLNGIFSY